MIIKRQEGDIVPQGFSYTEPGAFGRLHLYYREDDKIICFRVPENWRNNLSQITTEILTNG